MKNPVTLDKLLNSGNHELASLITRARKLASYNVWLQSQLPAPLNELSAVADIQGDTLILSVENAIWATKMRFTGTSILAQMKTRFPELQQLQQLKIIVAPRLPEDLNKSEKPASFHLSEKNALIIKSLAESIDDAPLRAALERLAKHAEK